MLNQMMANEGSLLHILSEVKSVPVEATLVEPPDAEHAHGEPPSNFTEAAQSERTGAAGLPDSLIDYAEEVQCEIISLNK